MASCDPDALEAQEEGRLASLKRGRPVACDDAKHELVVGPGYVRFVTASVDSILSHAERLAEDLAVDMQWHEPEPGFRGYWEASSPQKLTAIRARASRAIAFLQLQTGEHSQWTMGARAVLQSNGENQSMESGARAVGELLREWVDEVRAGFAVPRLADALGVRALASSELMDQVRMLVADRSVHPAAPIVLAGAALEMTLRSALESLGLDEPAEPSLQAYAVVLRDAGVLNRQDMKDITQIGGVRNLAAAHGSFDEISHERAGLLEQQVNLTLAQLPGKLEAAARA